MNQHVNAFEKRVGPRPTESHELIGAEAAKLREDFKPVLSMASETVAATFGSDTPVGNLLASWQDKNGYKISYASSSPFFLTVSDEYISPDGTPQTRVIVWHRDEDFVRISGLN